jgi:sigma-B regulation protein RsbU (phosphoserine phosphatase)
VSNNSELSILLIDDEPIGLNVLGNTLQKEGYRIIVANNGSQGRRLAFEEKPDIILLDIVMPDEDGFEVIRHLKRDPRTSNIPVIFLSGKDELDSKMTGFDLGAVDYITKPFYGQEVIARVRSHLKLSRATNSLIARQAEKLDQIKDAQVSMLVKPEDFPDACFSVYYMALAEAGGDFYDVFKISSSIFGYFVADVSGHDIATSYITSAVRALLKQNCLPIYQPVESMTMINNALKKILSDGKYLTACYARLNRKTEQMCIVNCGHPPVVYLPKDGVPRFIEVPGDVLGIYNDGCFGVEEIKVNRGDRFFMYSDGLIEKPGDRKVWTDSLDDLLDECDRLRNIPISDSAERLKNMMQGKMSSGFEDDIVVLGIEVPSEHNSDHERKSIRVGAKGNSQTEVKGMELDFSATLEDIDMVVEKTKEFLRRNGVRDQAFDILVGVREALVNAVIHGNYGDKEKSVSFRIRRNDDCLVIRVKDEGKGFDWKMCLEKVLPSKEESGRGLTIMKNIFSAMRYNKKGNILTLKIKI